MVGCIGEETEDCYASLADVVCTSYSFRRRFAFVPLMLEGTVLTCSYVYTTYVCVLEVSNSSMPWCCGIAVANSSNVSTSANCFFLHSGMNRPVLNGPVMNRPRNEPTVLNRPVMKRPVMKRPGILCGR